MALNTEETLTLYSLDVLKDKKNEELLEILKRSWGIKLNEDIEVWGKFDEFSTKANYTIYRIIDVSLVKDNKKIEYPIDKLVKNESISEIGIFISINTPPKVYDNKKDEFFAMCTLELSTPEVRLERKNPLILNATKGSVKMLKRINSTSNNQALVKDGDIYIESAILESIKEDNRFILEQEVEKEKEKHQEGINEIKSEIVELEKYKDEMIVKSSELTKKISEKESSNESLIKEATILTKEKKSIDKKIKTLRKKYEDDLKKMNQKLEKFKSFVKAKADVLLSLEFIDEEEYNSLLGLDINKGLLKENSLDFGDDLSSNFSSATSHIQAYLFNRDIMYPKYIIEDFFALIQTNDLIILAGESGSGKTNLVKSFADSVGGISKVIPVKPNWTSSEDLLGYYNPLEKKYLSTPFLEALLEASLNPNIPYFICLDEMNLARVEYYFADFLSILEERENDAIIHLYSDDESSHVLSEFNNVLDIIESAKAKYKKKNIVNYLDLIKDKDINEELKRVFGFSDKDSLIKYHSDLRRMISGIINIPSSIVFPKNVRIIGAINIDETTHYLSPKILDRAHIMKFDSPLLFNWDEIASEISDEYDKEKTIKFDIKDFGERNSYPKFDSDNNFCTLLKSLTEEFFTPMGVEVGMRTIRQGLNYQDKLNNFGVKESLFINNFFIHKILPKMTFDGSKTVGEEEKKDLLIRLQSQMDTSVITEKTKDTDGLDAIKEFDELVLSARANDWIVNYWT